MNIERFVKTDHYKGPERRREVYLSDDQIEQIAEEAAKRALKHMIEDGYKAVGKNVIEKGAWVVGVLACGIFAWLASKGFIKVG